MHVHVNIYENLIFTSMQGVLLIGDFELVRVG